VNIRAKSNLIRTVYEPDCSEEESKAKEFDPIIVSITMAATTLVQLSLQIPKPQQVEHKPFSLRLRSLSASTSIHRSTYASNFVIKTPLFFAVVSNSGMVVHTPLTIVASGMVKWLELYNGVLVVTIMLSWFPNIPWDRQPLSAIRDMCDPYLNLFRNILPPIHNALDVSPILAFIVLGDLVSVLRVSVLPRS
jgi:uncharacterized protein YggT (Ycf19 family)